jgi:CRISPR system Cascade subunit CasE
MSPSLHLVRCAVDARKLYAFARRSGAVARDFDEGYAVHALFAALFDHGAAEDARVAPKPFHVVDPTHRTLDVLGYAALDHRALADRAKTFADPLDVLGYAALDHRALADRAKTFADPLAWGPCDIEGMVSKPMPSAFEGGMRLGFSVRVCPIRRIAKRGPMTSDRAEVDAFLARSWEVGKDVPLDRGEVYRAWLDEELAKEGASKVLEASMTSFQLGRLHRRTHGEERKGRRTERPDVTFEGVLEVGDPAAFAHRLARGVGRHRAFGFGMLLLRPARRG